MPEAGGRPLPPELRELAEAVDVHRERLERLIEHRGVGGLNELYEEMRVGLRAQLEDLIAHGRGETMTAAQTRALLVQVEDAIAGFSGGFLEHLSQVGADAQTFAGEELIDELQAIAPEFKSAITPLSIAEIATFRGLAGDVEQSMLRRYRLKSLNWSLETIEAAERELAHGLALNRTAQEHMDALQGVMDSSEYQAERIVRTELMDAHARTSQAGIRQMAKDDVPGLMQQWFSSGRKGVGKLKKGGVCDLCRKLHGRVRAIGESFGTNKSGKKIMKPTDAHPNDMCVIVPYHPDWSRREAQQVADKLAPPTEKG